MLEANCQKTSFRPKFGTQDDIDHILLDHQPIVTPRTSTPDQVCHKSLKDFLQPILIDYNYIYCSYSFEQIYP